MVALWSAFFGDVARCHYQGNILLGYHPPQVLESVLEGTLTCDYLAVAHVSERPINKVGIDIAALEISALSNARTINQVNS